MKKTTKILALSFIAMAFAFIGCKTPTESPETPEQILSKCDQDVDKAKLEKKDLSGEWEQTSSSSINEKGHESYDISKATVTLIKDNTKYKVILKKGASFSSEGKKYLTEQEKAFSTNMIEYQKKKIEEDYDDASFSTEIDENGYYIYKISGKAKADKDWGSPSVIDLNNFKTNADMTAFASETKGGVFGGTIITTYVKK